jgi:hypothetical protein
MGILGEYPAAEMLEKLKKECLNWEKADSTFPVKPARFITLRLLLKPKVKIKTFECHFTKLKKYFL